MTSHLHNFRRSRRRAFTLLELMVVIGILLLLAGILLPVVNRARRSAQIAGMKLNFHSLITALEAYRQDFGAYPKNPFALIDSQLPNSSAPDAYRPCVPRSDPTLAMALLGPGPANSIVSSTGSVYPNGDVDGADGPGFRTRMAVWGTATIASASSTSVMLSPPPANMPTIPTAGVTPPFTAVGIGPPGSPDAQIPITSANASGQINLARPLYGTYSSGNCVLLIPAGKAFDGYIKADQFKVGYVQIQNQLTSLTPITINGTSYPYPVPSYEAQPLPVLLDNWGGPILYFPAYNSYAGRLTTTGNPAANVPTALSAGGGAFPSNVPSSAQTPSSPVQVGPIFGSPSLTNFSENSPVDSNKDTIPSVFWSGPLWSFTPGQVEAVLVKLGDLNADNLIDGTETLNVQTPFFLMSAGPDGMFTDLTNINPRDWARFVSAADDVYSFEP